MNSEARDTLGPIYDALQNRMIDLHATWKIYLQLFGTTEGRVKLLNRLIPCAALFIQRALIDEVILGICRLCDPARLGKFENVSIEALIAALDPKPDAEKLGTLNEQLMTINDKRKDLEQHRNKRIAHNDQRCALDADEALPPVTRQAIQEVLSAMYHLLNDINHWYLDKESVYTPSMRGDGDGLIHWLQYGERLSELQDDSWGGRLTDGQVIEKLRLRMLGEPT
jgi:AbiU2